MKGRGTRKCKATGKELYKLVDFVDITQLEQAITNDTHGVEDEPIEQEEEEFIDRERRLQTASVEQDGGSSEDDIETEQKMVIADVPVHLVFSETISPAILEQLRKQVESQLKSGLDREGLSHSFFRDRERPHGQK